MKFDNDDDDKADKNHDDDDDDVDYEAGDRGGDAEGWTWIVYEDFRLTEDWELIVGKFSQRHSLMHHEFDPLASGAESPLRYLVMLSREKRHLQTEGTGDATGEMMGRGIILPRAMVVGSNS